MSKSDSTRICTDCNEAYPDYEYRRSHGRKCATCWLARQRAYRHRNRERMNAYSRTWAKTHQSQQYAYRKRMYNRPWSRAVSLCKGARSRAKMAGLPFTITSEWVYERLMRGVCEVTGIPFELTRAAGEAGSGPRYGPWAPSLDRIVYSTGYTMENTRLVVWLYNLAKNRWTDAEVERLAEAIVAMRGRDAAPKTPKRKKAATGDQTAFFF